MVGAEPVIEAATWAPAVRSGWGGGFFDFGFDFEGLEAFEVVLARLGEGVVSGSSLGSGDAGGSSFTGERARLREVLAGTAACSALVSAFAGVALLLRFCCFLDAGAGAAASVLMFAASALLVEERVVRAIVLVWRGR